jgi:hypothetical protein
MQHANAFAEAISADMDSFPSVVSSNSVSIGVSLDDEVVDYEEGACPYNTP